MSDVIQIQQINAVCVISFNRPEKKNAITQVMYQALAEAINGAANNPQCKVVVLKSANENFTAGNDLADFLSNPTMHETSPVYQFLKALIFCPLPIIASVKGFAIGIGSTLLLHCEQVFADKTAQLALPFINLGLVPEACSSLLLPQLIGYQKAADLLLTGRNFGADEALSLGFISQIAEDCDAAAISYANALCQKPRTGLIETKRLLKKAAEPLPSRLKDELAAFVAFLQAPAAKEALTAFIEKRAADFTNF